MVGVVGVTIGRTDSSGNRARARVCVSEIARARVCMCVHAQNGNRHTRESTVVVPV